jgi:hypothetical protein
MLKEPLPEPTPTELAREAEQEASVFAQAANVDRLLTMLREMEKGTSKENLADNEEIQVSLLLVLLIAFSHFRRSCTGLAWPYVPRS